MSHPKRTQVQLTFEGDLWPLVDTWARSHKFAQIEGGGDERTYQKGSGFLVAPMMLTVKRSDNNVSLEAWIRAGLFVRISSLFMLPAEIGVHSGGFKAVAPRKMARKAINELISQLGGTEIS